MVAPVGFSVIAIIAIFSGILAPQNATNMSTLSSNNNSASQQNKSQDQSIAKSTQSSQRAESESVKESRSSESSESSSPSSSQVSSSSYSTSRYDYDDRDYYNTPRYTFGQVARRMLISFLLLFGLSLLLSLLIIQLKQYIEFLQAHKSNVSTADQGKYIWIMIQLLVLSYIAGSIFFVYLESIF